MPYLFLVSFIGGLLLAVRLMFFGAERRRAHPVDGMPLRRSEPALVGFLVMFGIAGYLLTRHGALAPWPGLGAAALLGIVWALAVARIAIMMARVTPEHDPDDPRFALQGHVAVVTAGIPEGGEGALVYGEGDHARTLRARGNEGQEIPSGAEVCIERVEHDVAYVELWSLVEARL